MANLRVFVSSTAYDLAVLRSTLRNFIEGLGYDPILSDYSDVLYDPREHAHRSCLAEIRTCDMVVLIVGSRFGSALNVDALSSTADLDVLRYLEEDGDRSLSVTQAEAVSAVAHGIPIFAFVDSAVYHDYFVHQRNKGQPFAREIIYPSVSQPDTAEYIFDFIDYLQGRSFNNAVITFDRMEDILVHLQKQWAGLFQRMLSEARSGHDDRVRIDKLAEQFDDLKTALLATLGDAGSRSAARAVVRYRRLLDFLRQLPNPGRPLRDAVVQAEGLSFAELLRETAHIVAIEEDSSSSLPYTQCVFRVEGDEDLWFRGPSRLVERFGVDWQSFQALGQVERGVAFDALADLDEQVRPTMIRRLSTRRKAEASSEDSVVPVPPADQEIRLPDVAAGGDLTLGITHVG